MSDGSIVVNGHVRRTTVCNGAAEYVLLSNHEVSLLHIFYLDQCSHIKFWYQINIQ